MPAAPLAKCMHVAGHMLHTHTHICFLCHLAWRSGATAMQLLTSWRRPHVHLAGTLARS